METEAAAVAGQRVAAHFENLRASLCAYALTVVYRPEIAEDLTQESFLRLYTHLADGNEVDNPKAWVFRVCHNLAINHVRKNPRDRARAIGIAGASSDGFWNSLVDVGPDPELRLLETERNQRLEESLGRLTERQRQCLYLRAEGFRYREIAKQLDITISTVVDTLTRAVERLRKSNHR